MEVIFIFSTCQKFKQQIGWYSSELVRMHIRFFPIILLSLYFFCLKAIMSRALLIIDVQNDFCQGGTLTVPRNLQIFPYINTLKKMKNFFSLVVLTRDWHPPKHVSFASTHNRKPFTSIQINGLIQELWPDHCVANTRGAQLSPLLQLDPNNLIINKGTQTGKDSYSAFECDNNGNRLKNLLQNSNIKQVYICGLAFDFCVGSTALDAQKYGFKTFVIEQATKSVMAESQRVMRQKLKENKVCVISFEQLKEE